MSDQDKQVRVLIEVARGRSVVGEDGKVYRPGESLEVDRADADALIGDGFALDSGRDGRSSCRDSAHPGATDHQDGVAAGICDAAAGGNPGALDRADQPISGINRGWRHDRFRCAGELLSIQGVRRRVSVRAQVGLELSVTGVFHDGFRRQVFDSDGTPVMATSDPFVGCGWWNCGSDTARTTFLSERKPACGIGLQSRSRMVWAGSISN